ncbi:unnamed protein product [Callosobruchus maculatus]|uniref:Uncharacterized protein n=1 Tax=Callosobruchus maculatus TaxID=64391 RepID=A0A653CV64_CALMS|nr:unnamed protein product [Callosobruchus maculatus]
MYQYACIFLIYI